MSSFRNSWCSVTNVHEEVLVLLVDSTDVHPNSGSPASERGTLCRSDSLDRRAPSEPLYGTSIYIEFLFVGGKMNDGREVTRGD
jgi:hypothetical protein